eukprot:2459298-Pleurochrysis_carterae.AAC.1
MEATACSEASALSPRLVVLGTESMRIRANLGNAWSVHLKYHRTGATQEAPRRQCCTGPVRLLEPTDGTPAATTRTPQARAILSHMLICRA